MSKLIIGLTITGTVWVASGVAFVVLLLIEGRRAAPRVRHRMEGAPDWLRAHAPEVGGSSAELAALRDELRELRGIVEERVPGDVD